MDLTLWIVASLLAAVFLLAGGTKLAIPRQKLAQAPGGGWVNDFGATFVKTLGAVGSWAPSDWSCRRPSTSRRCWCRSPRWDLPRSWSARRSWSSAVRNPSTCW